MGEAGFKEIRNSVTRRQNTVAQYIVTCTLWTYVSGPLGGRE